MIPDRLVVDSSIAIKWLVDEPDSEAAIPLVAAELWAPTFIYTECANVLWKKARRAELTAAEAEDLVGELFKLPLQVVDDRQLSARALSLALSMRHPVYDCVYLTLAERVRAPLVTSDKKLSSKVLQCDDFSGSILTLEDLA